MQLYLIGYSCILGSVTVYSWIAFRIRNVFIRSFIPLPLQFRYATLFDWLLMLLGSLLAVCHGVALPMLMLVFGDLTNAFINFEISQQLASEFSNGTINWETLNEWAPPLTMPDNAHTHVAHNAEQGNPALAAWILVYYYRDFKRYTVNVGILACRKFGDFVQILASF